MPYSKDPSAYPPEFSQLFVRAQSERIEIPLQKKSIAITLRHQLNAYRRARETVCDEGYSSLRNVYIRREDSTIILEPNPITAALKQFSVQPSEKDLDDYIQRMMEKTDGES